jgi:Phage integrase, N-terminal SAM-like domain
MSAYYQTPNPLYIREPGQGTSSTKGKRLLDQYRDAMRVRHYSYRTEVTYISWVRQYILFHKKRHPREMGVNEINAFITYLVNEKHIAASTHTAPAAGAGGTRRLARSSFSIVMC